MAICLNYLDLIDYQLNKELNRQKKENVVKFVKDVSLKLTACSMRVLLTNKDKPHKVTVRVGKKKTKEFKLIGIQAVLDSILLQASFFKKDIKPRAKRLKNISKGKTQRWAAQDAYGRIEMTYASFFDGRNLININPLHFEELRKKNWESNINNPSTFNKFFDLRDINLDEENMMGEKSNHLFEFDYKNDFLPSNIHPNRRFLEGREF
jgi:hypothetical protein